MESQPLPSNFDDARPPPTASNVTGETRTRTSTSAPSRKRASPSTTSAVAADSSNAANASQTENTPVDPPLKRARTTETRGGGRGRGRGGSVASSRRRLAAANAADLEPTAIDEPIPLPTTIGDDPPVDAPANLVLPRFPCMMPETSLPAELTDHIPAEADDIFVGACAVTSLEHFNIPPVFFSATRTYTGPVEAVFGEVTPFGIEPVNVCARYRITPRLSACFSGSIAYCYKYADDAKPDDPPLHETIEYWLPLADWSMADARKVKQTAFAATIAADEYSTQVSSLEPGYHRYWERVGRCGRVTPAPSRYKIDIRTRWQRVETGVVSRPVHHVSGCVFTNIDPSLAPFIRVVVRAEPGQSLACDENNKYTYKWCLYLRAAAVNAAVRAGNIQIMAHLRRLLTHFFPSTLPTSAPSSTAPEHELITVPIVDGTEAVDADLSAYLNRFDLLPAQTAMVAAMLAKEQAAFEPIQVPIDPPCPIPPVVQLGLGGVFWSSKSLFFGETRASVDLPVPQKHALAICPFFVDVSSPESDTVTTALALIAAGNRFPRPLVPALDLALAYQWRQPQDSYQRVNSTATLVICPRLLVAQWVAEALTTIGPSVIVISSMDDLEATTWSALSAAQLVIVAKEFLMHEEHLDALTTGIWTGYSSMTWSRLIPETLAKRPRGYSSDANIPHTIAERVADVACILETTNASGPQSAVEGAPSLHRIHWRRIIAHKMPWTINDPIQQYGDQRFLLIPILSIFSADAWVSLVPPAPTPPGHDPSHVSVTHLQEVIAGAVLTDVWQRDPPTHAFKHIMSAVARCCFDMPAPIPIPPFQYSEVSVYLSPAETAISGLATLLHPSDDELAVRAVQHHLMVSFAMVARYRPVYRYHDDDDDYDDDYDEEKEEEVAGVNETPPYLPPRMAAQTHRFLDIRKTLSLVPFVNSALLAQFYQRYPHNENDQISRGRSALGVLQWLSSADISRQIGQLDKDKDLDIKFDERLQSLLHDSQRDFGGRSILPMMEELQHFGIRAAEMLAAKPDKWSPALLAELRSAEDRQAAQHDATALPLAERHPFEFDHIDAQSRARILMGPSMAQEWYYGHKLALVLEQLQLRKNFKTLQGCLHRVAKRALTYYDTHCCARDACEHLRHQDHPEAGAALLVSTDRALKWACDACRVTATAAALLPSRDAPDCPVFACWPKQFESARSSSEQRFQGRVLARRVIDKLDQFPLHFDGSTRVDKVLNDDLRQYPRKRLAHIPAKDFINVCGMRVIAIVTTIEDMVAQDPGAKVVVFCEYQQQINLIHDALIATGTRCAALRHGVQSYLPLREFKCGLAPGQTKNDHPIDTSPAPVLVMPYSVCDSSLNLVEATHVIMSHPYVGIDKSLTRATPKDTANRDEKEFGRGNWSEERWEYERLKWREVERRAVSCIVRPGQARSVQVIRLYAAGTREAMLAQQFGNPLMTAPSSGIMAAVDQDWRNRFPEDWSRPGTVRSADAPMYSSYIG